MKRKIIYTLVSNIYTNVSSYWNNEKAQKELDPGKSFMCPRPECWLVYVQGNAIVLQEEKIKILVFKDAVQLKSP